MASTVPGESPRYGEEDEDTEMGSPGSDVAAEDVLDAELVVIDEATKAMTALKPSQVGRSTRRFYEVDTGSRFAVKLRNKSDMKINVEVSVDGFASDLTQTLHPGETFVWDTLQSGTQTYKMVTKRTTVGDGESDKARVGESGNYNSDDDDELHWDSIGTICIDARQEIGTETAALENTEQAKEKMASEGEAWKRKSQCLDLSENAKVGERAREPLEAVHGTDFGCMLLYYRSSIGMKQEQRLRQASAGGSGGDGGGVKRKMDSEYYTGADSGNVVAVQVVGSDGYVMEINIPAAEYFGS
eukprot:GFYU01008055.1.p1 GENE.GFYU01008055.1~~GFYU01008055.1.p1  ORF type:complete len:309 (+),score=82.90 GFYU01008055.1:30-929(+)